MVIISFPYQSGSSKKTWKIGKLNHVAIAVPDLGKASKLFRDVLGANVSEAQVRILYVFRILQVFFTIQSSSSPDTAEFTTVLDVLTFYLALDRACSIVRPTSPELVKL